MSEYIKLLRSEPVLRRLSLMQLISYFGAWFSNVAIYTLLVELNVSAFIIAMVASFHFLPGVLQAPISGVIIDKISPKKLMLILIVLEIISTFFLLFITNLSHLWLLFVLVFIRMGAASFYFTIEMSLLPKILEGKSLQYANEIHSIIWSLSYTVGMALSGFLVYKLGVNIAFILDGSIFIIAFILLINLKLDISFEKSQESFVDTFKEGLIYLKENKKILHLIMIHASVGFTVFDALVTLMAKQYYASLLAIPLAIGLLHSIRAFALVIGPIVLGKWVNSARLSYLLLLQGLGIMVWASMLENIYLSLIGSFIAGFSTTTLWSYTYTLIQKHTDKKYYGRVVAYNDMSFLLTSAISSIFVGVLIESSWSISSVLYLLGGCFVGVSMYYLYVRKVYNV
ncbi:MAG TPA: MFS transporter [Sulfurimonas sp.]|nr:MFS transporter [Sulfurimonas sp.]